MLAGVLAESSGLVTVTLAVPGAVVLVGYLLRELNRSSGGAWRVVREKNLELDRLRWEVAHERFLRAQCEGWATEADDPGPYKPPTDKELKTW